MLRSLSNWRVRLALTAVSLALAGCQQLPGVQPDAREQPRRQDGAIPSVLASMKQRAQPAPPWMVGSFVGTALRSGLQNIDLSVAADGSLRGRVGDLQASGQYIGNSRILWAHGNEAVVERRGEGFRVTQVKDPANVIEYRRR